VLKKRLSNFRVGRGQRTNKGSRSTLLHRDCSEPPAAMRQRTGDAVLHQDLCEVEIGADLERHVSDRCRRPRYRTACTACLRRYDLPARSQRERYRPRLGAGSGMRVVTCTVGAPRPDIAPTASSTMPAAISIIRMAMTFERTGAR